MLGLSPALFKSLVSISIPLQGHFALEQIYKLQIALENYMNYELLSSKYMNYELLLRNYINYKLLSSKFMNKKIYFDLRVKCVFSRVLLFVVRLKIRHLRPT